MSRTYRSNSAYSPEYRNPQTMNERRQLKGLKTDARTNQVSISPVNRLSRHLPSNYDDLKVSSFRKTYSSK